MPENPPLYAADQEYKRHKRTAYENHTLHNIGPDNCFDAAHRTISDGHQAHQQDADINVDSGHRIQRQRRQEEHDGYSGKHEETKEHRSQIAYRRTEPLLQILIGRSHVEFTEERQIVVDDDRHDHQDGHVEHEHAPVGAVGLRRDRDEGDRAERRGEDADACRPPRYFSPRPLKNWSVVLFLRTK